MLEVRDLRMVQAIHEQGSLARAARVLNMGQPALTRALATLELRLQGPLFERSRRGVLPTDLCRALLPGGGEILRQIEQLGQHLTEARGAQTQTLTVAAGGYAAESIAIVAAARMLAVHPTVRLRLLATNWADVVRMVREREVSVGVVDLSALGEAQDLDVETLLPQPGVIVVRAGHPLAGKDGLCVADIFAWPLIMMGRMPRRVQAPLTQAREQARAAGPVHPAFPALIHESPTVALRAVRHSDAIAAVTLSIAADALRSGDLVALRWRAPWMSVRWGIIRPRHRRPTEAEEAFLDLLRTADRESLQLAEAFLAEIGLDTDCGAAD